MYLEIVQEAPLPPFHVLPDESNEGLDLVACYVLIEQLLIVVQQSSDGVLRQNVVANLLLHEPKLLGDVLLTMEKKGTNQ